MRLALISLLMIPLVVGCGGGDKEQISPPWSADTADTYVDADNDGVPADQDCDDEDAGSTILADDADCDTVVTAEDCDDTDLEVGALCWVDVSAGESWTCGLKSDASVQCWDWLSCGWARYR